MIYPYAEIKRLSEPEPYLPQNLDETRDELLRVFLKDGFCIAIFRFGAVALPEELEPKLCNLVGHKIGILCLNGWHVRDLGVKDAA